MVQYLRTGWAAVALLATLSTAQAADLSMTPIYKGRAAVLATDWELADRWMIYSSFDTGAGAPLPAQADDNSKNHMAWSTGTYTLLTRWGLKGEYIYVNFLDSGINDPPAGITTVAKTSAPPNRRALRIGGNYGF